MRRGEKPIHIPPPEQFTAWPSEIMRAWLNWQQLKHVDPYSKGSQEAVVIVLPLPPSANRYWRLDRGIPHRSKRADEYIGIVQWMCNQAGIEPLTGDVSCIAQIFRDNAARDLNNCTKVLYDAIQGYAILNDNQVCDERHIRDYDVKNPRVVLFIRPQIPADEGKIKSRRKKD